MARGLLNRLTERTMVERGVESTEGRLEGAAGGAKLRWAYRRVDGRGKRGSRSPLCLAVHEGRTRGVLGQETWRRTRSLPRGESAGSSIFSSFLATISPSSTYGTSQGDPAGCWKGGGGTPSGGRAPHTCSRASDTSPWRHDPDPVHPACRGTHCLLFYLSLRLQGRGSFWHHQKTQLMRSLSR